MANSADPDPTDLDLHCLQDRVYPGSAGQGLISTRILLNDILLKFMFNQKRLGLSKK